jgi:hypothetical protein
MDDKRSLCFLLAVKGAAFLGGVAERRDGRKERDY